MKVQNIKERYPKRTRIKCIDMKDNDAIETGTKGTVNHVDDMGTIHVTWDNGRTLGLIYGVDTFEKIYETTKTYEKENVDLKIKAPLFKKQSLDPQRHNVKHAFKVSGQELDDLLIDPFKQRDYILDHKDEMFVDEYGVNQSILVYSDERDDGVLIESEGFRYPRYQSHLSNVHDLIDLSKHDGIEESKRFEKIKILVVEPNSKPYVAIIDNNLETLQSMVGGNIELIYLSKSAEIICNEEGKIHNLKANRRIGNDIIAGRFIIVGNDGGEQFTSLSREDINKYMEQYLEPEQITQEELQSKMLYEIIF